jgi:hypothetical protein
MTTGICEPSRVVVSSARTLPIIMLAVCPIRRETLSLFLSVLFLFTISGAAADEKTVPLRQTTENALKLSKITLPGSTPFHLRAIVAQDGKKDSSYNAEIEEFWIAPDKWRRLIKSSTFSQVLIVNGDKISEQNTGSYYPFWLRDLVTAVVDVLPDDFSPRDLHIESSERDDRLIMRQKVMGGITTSTAETYTGICSSWNDNVGTVPAQNSVYSKVCFQGQDRVLWAVFTPYFHAEFSDFKDYKEKKVPRLISIAPGQDVRLKARVIELSELRHPDESLFTVTEPTPVKDRFYSVRVREQDALSRLLNSPQIAWSLVPDGKTSGNFSLMVYVDKEGRVQEIWRLSTDNPSPQEQACKELMQWRFTPLERDGAPAQMEALLTFHFDTTHQPGFTVLSNEEGRKLAISKTEPHFLKTNLPKRTEFTVRIAVDENGRLATVENFYKIAPALFEVAKVTLQLWRFKPRIVNHKPEGFTADITFQVR